LEELIATLKGPFRVGVLVFLELKTLLAQHRMREKRGERGESEERERERKEKKER